MSDDIPQEVIDWIEDGDRNSEYISVDEAYATESADAVPQGNIPMSVAGIFTFFLPTAGASSISVTLAPQFAHSVALKEFVSIVNKAKARTLPLVLDAATKAYSKVADARDAEVLKEEAEGGGGGVDDDEYTQVDDDDGRYFFGAAEAQQMQRDPEVIAREAARREADRKVRELREQFRATTVGLPQATIERLLKDLSQVQKNSHHGWDAQPLDGNLAVWEVQLFDFDKDTPLQKDMAKLAAMFAASDGGTVCSSITSRKGGCVIMHMKFPPQYPNKPPFIRVVNPRFMFRTGRVTVGGSLCTELLVQEGWQPVYDIESIIESLRQQITDPEAGARVDFANRMPYTEEEAIAAFNRVAMQHGWSVM